MRYITMRESYKRDGLLYLLSVILGIMLLILGIKDYIMYEKITDGGECLRYGLVGIVFGGVCFIYIWSDKWIRKRYYENGKRFDGVIVGAEHLIGKGHCYYFLIIQFYEDGRRLLRKSPRYYGNPNDMLSSPKCSIYKWKGKYMEGDFQVLDKEIKDNLNIPVELKLSFRLKEKKYV